MPIGVAFAVVLWLGNAAYLYLSVSFIQMIKALMPLSVRGNLRRRSLWIDNVVRRHPVPILGLSRGSSACQPLGCP